jgi:hypothetical protein
MIRSRQDLALAQRIVVKAGTSVRYNFSCRILSVNMQIVSTPEGFASLSRMANIVEHVSREIKSGRTL